MARADDDISLIRRIALGDEDALRQLYDAYHARLWRFLWLELDGNAEWIAEIAQDVFFAVWQSAGRFHERARVATWIFTIAHHRAANARRALASRAESDARPLPDDDAFDSGDASDSPESAVIDRLMLADALRRLTPAHQVVLNLYFYQGFSLAEIARILDIPVGTVKSRISYARRALLGQLREAGSRDA